jgi:hypothetical protein
MRSSLIFAVAALAHGSPLAAQSPASCLPAEQAGIHLTIVELVDHAADAPPPAAPCFDAERWVLSEFNPLSPEQAFCPRQPSPPREEVPPSAGAGVPYELPAGQIAADFPQAGGVKVEPVPEPGGALLLAAGLAAGLIRRRRSA